MMVELHNAGIQMPWQIRLEEVLDLIEARDGYINRQHTRDAFLHDLAVMRVRGRQQNVDQYIANIAGRQMVRVNGPTIHNTWHVCMVE